MYNTQKSFKGQPITNYIPYPYASYNGSDFVLAYNYQNNGATYTYVTGVPNPVNAPGVLEYYTGTTDYKYFAVGSEAVPTTGTYTFSYYARIVDGSTGVSNLNNNQLWRDNVLGDQSVTGDWNPTLTREWKRYSTTGPVQSGSALHYFPIHGGAITGGYTIQYCGFQLEKTTFSTPFVVGSRSNTQTLLDLTGNNTLTANSLTYSSANTFSFNGSSDYISAIPNTFDLSSGVSLEVLFNSSDLSSRAQGIMTLNSDLGRYINFYCPGDGTLRWETWNPYNTGGGAFYSSTLSNNTWYHAIGTHKNDGSSVLYINGSVNNSASFTPSTYSSSYISSCVIGSYAGYFSGNIILGKIYNKTLSANEVSQNFNAIKWRVGL